MSAVLASGCYNIAVCIGYTQLKQDVIFSMNTEDIINIRIYQGLHWAFYWPSLSIKVLLNIAVFSAHFIY